MKTRLFFVLLYLQVQLISGQTNPKALKLDSLKRELAQVKSDTDRVWLYNKLMDVAPNAKAALEYGQQGLGLSKHIRYEKGIIRCGIKLGAFLVEVDYYRAIPILTEMKQLCEKTNNQVELVRAFGFLGYAYNKFDFKKAQYYYTQCKQLMVKENVPESVFPITMVLGQFYKNWNLADSALVYLQKAYQIALKTNIPVPPSGFYVHFGVVYYKKGQSDLAMSYFRRSIATSTGTPHGQSYQGLALIFRDRNQLDSARFYAKKSLEIQQQRNQTIYVIESANLLFDLYKTSNPAEALNYHLLASATKDSLFNQEKARQVEKLAYEEREREARTKRRIEANQLAYQNQIRLFVLSGVLVGILLLVLFLYRNNRQKQKANALLQRQRDEIHEQRTQLQIALETLKSTQTQLIQQEKMASLGELTAGIAHEIQNPLNFVTNFSDVSVELIDELKDEVQAGHTDEVMALANDLTQNLQKITLHGKQASSIVRSMLEHSRTTTGERQATDLNALADEYLRLAYHGYRAKNKAFNAHLKTNFDPRLGLLDVVPQEIGRVLLNVFNNAFYALAERQKQQGASYEPTVSVSTNRTNGQVEIRVTDNGMGVPEAVRTKIFQPFFTTKPTGQGTGLGLSLSYDIISKGHGGTMTVETKEGAFSEFIITLPTT
ncbi:ATP-binding protein [Spirosoma areae]